LAVLVLALLAIAARDWRCSSGIGAVNQAPSRRAVSCSASSRSASALLIAVAAQPSLFVPLFLLAFAALDAVQIVVAVRSIRSRGDG